MVFCVFIFLSLFGDHIFVGVELPTVEVWRKLIRHIPTLFLKVANLILVGASHTFVVLFVNLHT